MARIGFLTLYATGHVTPSVALAGRLRESGHDVVMFNLLDTESAIRNAGLEFRSYGESAFPPGTVQELLATSGSLKGPSVYEYFRERMHNLFAAAFQGLPRRIEDASLDLLIVDEVHCAGGTLAEHAGVPFLSVAFALHIKREPLVPPPNTLWNYEDSTLAIERNLKGWEAVDHLFSPLLAFINQQRAKWGLEPYTNVIEDSISPLGLISQCPSVLDFPRTVGPEELKHAGHFTPALESDGFDREWLDGRPLIYVSFGTIQNGSKELFANAIAGLQEIDAQVVVTLGGGKLSPSDFGQIPANTRVFPRVPQRALLRSVALCITHAGVNTVLECLDEGVPMVCIPLASEQPGVAMRVARLGAGTVLPLELATPEEIRSSSEQVLGDPAFRKRAKELQEVLCIEDGAAEAVRMIEDVLTKLRKEGCSGSKRGRPRPNIPTP